MSKEVRLFIETGDREIYNELKNKPPLEGLQHSDVFCLAMGFGYKAGIRTPLRKKDGFIREATVKENHWRLIIAVAIASCGDLSIVIDKAKCGEIAAEYANAGLRIIMETDEWGISLEREIVDLYKQTKKQTSQSKKDALPDNDDADNILRMISEGESSTLEFKSSFRWDFENNNVNKELEYVIAKSTAGFMNAKGGILLIGVEDNGNILGLEKDYSSFKKKGRDGFELRFWEIIKTFIGVEYDNYISVQFTEVGTNDVCSIRIERSDEPIYLQKKGDSTEFVLRRGNSTVRLHPKETGKYVKTHWKD